jgi:cation diffusion facilitator family transporter
LVLLKLIIGMLIGSVSVISEAIHSGVDLLAAVIALFAVKTAGKPADEDHPFGHGKIENISGTVEALLIFLAAGWIIYEAVKKLRSPHEAVGEAGLGVLIMLISAIANIVVSQQLFKVGKATESVALQADAWHLRTDVYTSAGVMLGLAVIWVGQHFFHVDLHWVDPVAAIAVALLIIHAAWELTRQSARDLLDTSIPIEEEQWIRDYLCQLYPTIRGFHHLRTRKAGNARFVEYHLVVEAQMTVEASHRIAETTSDTIEARFPNSHVIVHIEPCNGSCRLHCQRGCLLNEAGRDAMKQPSRM